MWPSLLHQQPELPYREPEPVLVQEYQREVVARREVGGIQVEHALEFALRIFEHVRPIERDAEVSPLVQLRLATAHDLFGPPADRAREARLNEPEQRLDDSELGQTGAIDELLHRARAVDVLQDPPLLRCQHGFRTFDTLAGDLENEIHMRDLLLDDA